MSAAGEQPGFRLDGKVAAVTGGANGIGLATARALAGAGAEVVILDRDEVAAKAAAAGIPRARVAALDVADAAQVHEVFAGLGALDVLVNCAGTARRHAAVEHPLEDWSTVLAVNLTGTFLCARAAAAQMLARGGEGAIVNVSSIMGLSGGGIYPNISYQTSKGGVVNLTRALAVEWAPHGVRVNAVAPTFVDTAFIEPLLAQPGMRERIVATMPIKRLARAEEVAAGILFLASPAAAMITGHTLPIDGGFLAQ